MTVYVYATTRWEAEQWARSQGYRPRDVRAYGNNSSARGMSYAPDDRVVVLIGDVSARWHSVVERNCLKSNHEPPELLYGVS